MRNVKQLSLFSGLEDTSPAKHVLVAKVVFESGPEGVFDYRVPKTFVGRIAPGQRIRVPLGKSNRFVVAYCLEICEQADNPQLKDIAAIIDEAPLVTSALLRLAQWMAEYYLCPLGTVLETVIPACVRNQAGTRLVPHYRLAPCSDGFPSLTEKQARVVAALLEAPGQRLSRDALTRTAGCTTAVLDNLVKRGILVKEMARIRHSQPDATTLPRQERLILNNQQQEALEIIQEAVSTGEYRGILIYGVTGSGKTEVYIQAIEYVVKKGKQAIVLVPEISLTPQTVERFRSRFDYVAVLHSHLTDAERAAQWDWIASGQVQVVVGARSAIFAPTPHLGLIVMDEEHETSFKQEAAPRYHARDVALRRAQIEQIPLVLGSATPSLESWYRTQQGELTLIRLPERIGGRTLPAVKPIDLRQPKHSRASRGVITRQLHAAIHEALENGGQVILLLNRRGFATHVQCSACGYVLMCPDCEIALTHHRSFSKVLCHYCGHEAPSPKACPECQSAAIRFSGVGTERLEAEVKARFPEATCLRMDADSMRSREAYERAFRLFREGKIQILLGTQMIAKGLDFPNVTLVGVVNADTALHFPDFRAAERTFQMVTQVAGRTGRGPHGGLVLVQTFSPEHFAIQSAVRHDFEGFAAQELPIRMAFGYPPISRLVRLIISAEKELEAAGWAERVARSFSKSLSQTGRPDAARVVGPAPAPLMKLRGKYRYHIQILGKDERLIRTLVRCGLQCLEEARQVSWVVDVDPVDML